MRFLFLLSTIIISSCSSSENSEASIRNEIMEEAKPVYVDAFVKINTLKNYIHFVDDGTMDKKQVVNEYNNTFGYRMGFLKTFAEVKQRIETAGDAFIDYVYKKECARIALMKSANIQFEISESENFK